MEQPVIVTQPGVTVSGELRLEAHNRQSYDVHVTLRAPPLAPGGPEQVGGAWAGSRGALQVEPPPGLPRQACGCMRRRLPCSSSTQRSVPPPPPPLQVSTGKFDLKEPYYRQQMQWMMQMAQATVPTAAAGDDGIAGAAGAAPAAAAAPALGAAGLAAGQQVEIS